MSDEDLSEFLLHACHDLRGSLRAIRAHIELLQRDRRSSESPDYQQRLGFIADGAHKIESLAEGLAGYSIALQTSETSFRFVRMDIALRTALARLDQELRDHDAAVTAGELPRVFGNPDRLAQIFEILLRSALSRRAELSPKIHIGAEKQGDEWVFSVEDNGSGIDTASPEKIFTPFRRLVRNERDGAGLSLAICREIVERHGGRLWVRSEGGTGSAFFFTLASVSE